MSEITLEQSEAYVDSGGSLCPVCKKDAVEASDNSTVEIIADGAFQDCQCTECGATWTDCYNLVAAQSID